MESTKRFLEERGGKLGYYVCGSCTETHLSRPIQMVGFSETAVPIIITLDSVIYMGKAC